ncbi:MAG: GNAT family N-acetyltransferase [Chloroflexota bacterium]
MNPQMHIYASNADLPAAIRYQVHSFMRIEWYDMDDYDMDSGVENDELHPSYVALTNGNTLLSFATVVRKMLELNGEKYICYGLANVMTFPHFRKRGFAGQVVEAATKIIRESDADIALLWTEQQNIGFYGRSGWETLPGLVTLVGDPQNPKVYADEPALMQFLSDKGQAARPDFEHGRVYVGAWTW